MKTEMINYSHGVSQAMILYFNVYIGSYVLMWKYFLSHSDHAVSSTGLPIFIQEEHMSTQTYDLDLSTLVESINCACVIVFGMKYHIHL